MQADTPLLLLDIVSGLNLQSDRDSPEATFKYASQQMHKLIHDYKLPSSSNVILHSKVNSTDDFELGFF